ncbi:MAG TPA: ABC transporter ATP-binding protein [Candidatus Binatia bacterium]|nr:ABC transporter ATP-binding protein [Candidatus Binatia bacterium]
MASLSLKNLSLVYPNGVRALDEVELEIADGEFLAVLGPSGSGKSSLLRLVAGLEAPTGGYIDMDGRDITHLEPKDRDVAMVFQGLALYPHMTVWENMAFGLLARKAPAAEIEERVGEAAATLGLAPHLKKRPRELSGGERQRVALGRALVRRPRVYLFDEPLSSLDAQLRQELREELARLHALTRTTSIYVTHDQKEALSLGRRVAVFDRGRIRQVGTPEAIYRDPRDLFVARFVGDPAINLIEGEIVAENGRARFRAAGFTLALASSEGHKGKAILGVRPEAAGLGSVADASARATVDRVERLGGETLIHLRTEAGRQVLRAEPRGALPTPGDVVGIMVDPRRALFFAPDGARIRLD